VGLVQLAAEVSPACDIDTLLQVGEQGRPTLRFVEYCTSVKTCQKTTRIFFGKCPFYRVFQRHIRFVGEQGAYQGGFPGLAWAGDGDKSGKRPRVAGVIAQ
jgi:hypothetical protein